MGGFTALPFWYNNHVQLTNAMKAVKLTNRIRYFHCDGGDEGAHGVMVLLGAHGYPTKAVEILDQAAFKFWFRNYRVTEETADELAVATPTGFVATA